MPQPRIATEIELIADYLDEQLAALANAAHGLTEEQGRAAPCVSALSVGGLLKHTRWVMTEAARRRENTTGEVSPEEFEAHAGEFFGSFTLTDTESLSQAREEFEAARTTFIDLVRSIDPDAEVMVPPEPWQGRHEPSKTTERFHLLHMVEEFARHAGHADIIREQLDRATAIELEFAVEGREGNAWVTPWSPPDAQA